ncbi:MAG: MFS transporter [Clostridiales bacterium]|jgi:fucose permease|nr:MFS transporter [Clostridiales bacterium]
MTKGSKYSRTLTACYLAFITQAITANLAPLLFLRFHTEFGISLGKIAVIPIAFFITQLTVDLICAGYINKIGYRAGALISEALAGLGLIGLAVLPFIFPDPFTGILISVIVYAVGSGLIEVLASPIVEACPFDNKASVMSILHSFYCWGCVGVIVLSTVFFYVFGIGRWRWLPCIWALIPFINIINFEVCPIETLTEEGKEMSIGKLFKTPMFILGIVLMVCAGSSEIAMAQWFSAFAESAIGMQKTVGDLVGPCLFAVAMGISRVIYGKFGNKLDLTKYMLGSGAVCLACYLTASLSKSPAVCLAGCIICGFSVGIMWPGTISILSKRLPKGGTAMFAFLAMAGDLGGALGPGIVGFFAQMNNDDLKKGVLAGSVFPLVLVISVAGILIKVRRERKNKG